MMYNVGFSIRKVLMCDQVQKVEDAKFFKAKGAIFSAVIQPTCYVFPGVIELMKLLFRNNEIRVSFFGSGDAKVTKLFVDLLLSAALGKEEYEKIPESVKICSADDLDMATEQEKNDKYQIYGLTSGKYYKDISKLLRAGDRIENTFFFERYKAQCLNVKNVVQLQSIDNKTFINLKSERKNASYDNEGYKSLQCVLFIENNHFSEQELHSKKIKERQVANGKQILIVRKNDQYKVSFLENESYQPREEILSISPEVIYKLDQIVQEALSKFENTCLIRDHKILDPIYSSVNSLGGKINKICHKQNQIFFITGLLFETIEKSKHTHIPPADILFGLQFKKKVKMEENKIEYEHDFQYWRRMDHLYLLGLEKLREVNKDLTFITPKNYRESIELPITQEELLKLKEGMKGDEQNFSF